MRLPVFPVVVPVFAALTLATAAHAQTDTRTEVPSTVAERGDVDELRKILDGTAPKTTAHLRAMQIHVQRLIQRSLPAVVDLNGATGVIVEGGYVLTSGHVTEREGRTMLMTMHDGRTIEGKSLGLNENSDTGLIEITTEGKDWPTLEMGESGALAIGEWCVMFGHPSGSKPGRSAPARVGRVLRVPESGFLTTDCPMQGGDSGGPLLDMDGKVIGINSRISRNIAENMHTPIDAFRNEWNDLVAGTVVQSERNSRRSSIGLLWERKADRPTVRKVKEGKLGEEAGFQVGDVILEVGGEPVGHYRDVARLLSPRNRRSGEMTLKIEREGKELDIVLGGLPVVRSGGGGRRGPRLTAMRDEGVLDAFAPVVATVNRATAEISQGGSTVSLGLVVREDGVIVTKASVLDADEPVLCTIDGREFAADRLHVDELDDLAFLQVSAKELTVATLASSEPQPGTWLATVDGDGAPSAAGVLSSAPYHHSRKGFLGVTLDRSASPPRITSVSEDSAAERAGLEADDEVLALDDEEFETTQKLIEAIGKRGPGDKIKLRIRRDDEERELEAVLGQNRNGRSSAQEGLWGDLSEIRAGFGSVLQHDAIVQPDQCGGAIVDLDGNVIGLNIARAGRVETLALPIATVQRALSAK